MIPGSGFQKFKLLNLGCGNHHHPDWVNVDFHATGAGVIAHNLNKGIPFENNSFDVVYHSHLIEHFPKSYAPVFLKECHRVLKNSGIIRVVVPDLEQIVRWYLLLLEKSVSGDKEAQNKYEWIMLELFDQMVRNYSGGEMLKYWQQENIPAEDFVITRVGSEALNIISQIKQSKNYIKIDHSQNTAEHLELDPIKIGNFRLRGETHQWMYDRYSLGKLLTSTGFENIKVCKAYESAVPNFNQYLLDIESDGSLRKPDSLFMEATKP
jgi:predicted SAM-dependent methyltransferase